MFVCLFFRQAVDELHTDAAVRSSESGWTAARVTAAQILAGSSIQADSVSLNAVVPGWNRDTWRTSIELYTIKPVNNAGKIQAP